MAFCGKCGSTVSDGLNFCPNCGGAIAAPQQQPFSAAPPPPPPQYSNVPPPQYPPQYGAPQYGAPQYVAPAASGLQENVAGLFCYSLGWLTGIIFLLIDKRPFVRFHAAQSIVVFGVLHVIQIILAFLWVGSAFAGGGLWGIHFLVARLVNLVTLVAWVGLMVMAYQGKKFEVPVAAGIAKGFAGQP